jgi:hypothetical protein
VGATRFSDDPTLQDPLGFVRKLKEFPDLCQTLRDKTSVVEDEGRPRDPGDWALLYLAYTLSTDVDLTKFRRHYSESPLWELCGFAEMPGYWKHWRRFGELEDFVDGFLAVARELIQLAADSDARVGRWIDVDGSAVQFHARLEHCCPSRYMCQTAGGRAARYLPKATAEQINEVRQAEAEQAPVDDADLPGVATRTWVSGSGKRRYRYFRINGHLYRTKDVTAAPRTVNRKTWIGGNKMSATGRFTGGRIYDLLVRADTQEYSAFPELIDGAIDMLGRQPLGVSADRGVAVASRREYLTRKGIASNIPSRKRHPDHKREDDDTDRYDRHGVPRCQHCGGPGDLTGAGLGFYFGRANDPRLRFRCLLAHTDECAHTVQSISCSENWNVLLPLSRLTETYHALGRGIMPAERTHKQIRERYGAAASPGGSSAAAHPRTSCAWPPR